MAISTAVVANARKTVAASKGTATSAAPFTLSDAMVNYEKGELFATAILNAQDPKTITNGISIYVVPPDTSKAIYCGGMVGPPEGGSVQLKLPLSVATSTTGVSFTKPTPVVLLVIVVYNGTLTATLSQSFTVGG